MGIYQNAFRLELDKDEEEVVTQEEETPKTPEENTWRKRYSSLRQKESKDVARIKELETQLADAAKQQVKYPKTKEEIEAWRKKYPDVAGIVTSISMAEVQSLRDEIDQLRAKLNEDRTELDKDKAYNGLLRAHPDFEEVKSSSEFATFVDEQGDDSWFVAALFQNDNDVSLASRAVQFFKDSTGWGKQKKESKNTDREAARDIPRSHPSEPSGGKKVWKESEIEKLPMHLYEKNMEEIDKAFAEGRVEMDLSGAAR